MEQQTAPCVVPFRLPQLVRELLPGDLHRRIIEAQHNNCLFSLYNVDDQTLIMFRLKDSCIQNWFAESPLTCDEALAIVQDESIKERLPQNQNYFFEYTPPDSPHAS